MSRALHVSLALAVTASACGKVNNEEKRMQESAPLHVAEPPSDLNITVTVDGSGSVPITAEILRTVKPDFADTERRAWLISTLIVDAAATGTVVKATSPSGMSIELAHPMADGLEPVLFLTRRGEVIASVVDPKNPFPDYHGHGERLHRAGDALPRVSPVAAIAVTRSTGEGARSP